MKVLSSQVGWTDKDGTLRIVEQGDTLPGDAPAEKVKFWQATGMVTGQAKAAAKKAAPAKASPTPVKNAETAKK